MAPSNKKLRYPDAKVYSEADSEKVHEELFKKHQANYDAHVTHKNYDAGRWDYDWRIQQLYGLRDFLVENADEIFKASKEDVGRTKSEFLIDMGAGTSDLNLLIRKLKTWLKPVKHATPLWMQPGHSYVKYEPLGTILVLGTWNYATLLSILPVAGALASGNAVILKPSELAPAQADVMARLLPKYVDPAALSVLIGGPQISKALVDSYPWGKVFYTGGSTVGAIIGASCAARLIPCALELGGKSPTIILEDANLPVSCRRIVQGKFVNSGQTCIAPDYVIISGSAERQKEVTDAIVKEIKRQYPGDVIKSKEYARIVNVKHFNRIEGLMKSDGKIIHGGSADESQKFIEPTVVVDCKPNSPLMTEEIFGPVLPIIYVKDKDDAIAFINSKPKPLALYIFSSQKQNYEYILARTTSGSACVNEAVFQYLNSNLPFGGVGNSGMGAYHGKSSIHEFSHARSIMVKSTMFDLKLRYLPLLGKERNQNLLTFAMKL